MYVILCVLFLLSKARQAKMEQTEMKILQPLFGILVILTKNELTKICKEQGMSYDIKTNNRKSLCFQVWKGHQLTKKGQ